MATNSGGWLYEANGTPVDKATADNAQARVLEIKQDATRASADSAKALSTANSYAGEIARANTTAGSAVAIAQANEDTVERYSDDVEGLKVNAGWNAGSPNDAQNAAFLRDPNSESHSVLNAQTVGRGELSISASDYGADPSKTAAENRLAIQSALDAAGIAGRAHVTLPRGTYATDGVIDVREGTTLTAWGATLDVQHGGIGVRMAGSSHATPIRNVAVEGLGIIAQPGMSNGRGINVEFAQGARLSGLTISRPGNNAVDVRESSDVVISDSDISADDYGIFMYQCKDFTITGNTIHDVMNGIDVKGSLNASTDQQINGTITGNTIRDYKDHGITGAGLAEEGNLRGLVISSNAFRAWKTNTENSSGSAIEAGVMAVGYVIIGNTMIDPGSSGIAASGSGHVIQGNHVEWHRVTPPNAPAISVMSGSSVIGNTILRPGDGISVQGGIDDAEVLGNVIDSPARYGIHMNNESSRGINRRVSIAYNTVKGGTRGLYEQGAGGVDNQIHHNTVSGSSTANYSFVNTSTWRAFNRGAALASVGTAGGTDPAADAAVINSMVTALRQAGLVA